MNRKSSIYLIVIISLYVCMYIFSFANLKRIEKESYEKMPKEVQNITNKALSLVQSGEVESVAQLFVEEFRNKSTAIDELEYSIKQVSSYGRYRSKELIEYIVNVIDGVEYHTVTYELEYKNTWILFRTIVSTTDKEYKIYILGFDKIDIPIKKLNAFTLEKKTLIHYIILLLHIGITLFTFITSAICFGSNKNNRLLWTILILCGVGLVTFNWRTSEFNYNIFSIGIPATTISRAITVAPVVLKMRVPVMAIIYWLKRDEADTTHKS